MCFGLTLTSFAKSKKAESDSMQSAVDTYSTEELNEIMESLENGESIRLTEEIIIDGESVVVDTVITAYDEPQSQSRVAFAAPRWQKIRTYNISRNFRANTYFAFRTAFATFLGAYGIAGWAIDVIVGYADFCYEVPITTYNTSIKREVWGYTNQLNYTANVDYHYMNGQYITKMDYRN